MNLESAWWHAYNQQSKNEAICWRMSHLPRQAAYLNSNALPPSIMNTPPAWQMGNTCSILVPHSPALAADSTRAPSQTEMTEQARRGLKPPALHTVSSSWCELKTPIGRGHGEHSIDYTDYHRYQGGTQTPEEEKWQWWTWLLGHTSGTLRCYVKKSMSSRILWWLHWICPPRSETSIAVSRLGYLLNLSQVPLFFFLGTTISLVQLWAYWLRPAFRRNLKTDNDSSCLGNCVGRDTYVHSFI